MNYWWGLVFWIQIVCMALHGVVVIANVTSGAPVDSWPYILMMLHLIVAILAEIGRGVWRKHG